MGRELIGPAAGTLHDEDGVVALDDDLVRPVRGIVSTVTIYALR
jgi:hypothetical protein